jgi:hypothetical protein
MSAMDQSLSVQNLEILSNGDLRGIELVRHLRHQHSPIATKNLENGTAALFV